MYDLLIFDSSVASSDKSKFESWLQQELKRHQLPPVTVAETSTFLRSWYLAVTSKNPNLAAETSSTDYSIQQNSILATISWPLAEEARETSMKVAAACGVGVVEVSNESSEVWLPDNSGSLKLAFYID
ncbi:MAG: hypothetical protein KC777_09495 [Cyanobacteria bacterium HKST-UBA02]|nr:hypothetical protein [Cyanobacteria bacterium HKST-UBA02]